MKFNDYSRIADDRNRELELTRAFPMLMRKVYTWMTMALAITGIVAYGVSTSQSMMAMLYGGIALPQQIPVSHRSPPFPGWESFFPVIVV